MDPLTQQIQGMNARIARLNRDLQTRTPARMQDLLAQLFEVREQNESLLLAQETLEAERQRYRDLFEWAPDGYLVTDANGVIREANEAALAL